MKSFITAITLGCAGGGIPFSCCGPEHPVEMPPASVLVVEEDVQESGKLVIFVSNSVNTLRNLSASCA